MPVLIALLAQLAQPIAAASCTPATAIEATVGQVGGDLQKYMGRCVTVAGPFGRTALYGRVEDLYLANRYGLRGNPDPEVERRARVGLYSKNNELRQLRTPGAGLAHIRVTGTVDSCGRKQAAAEAHESSLGRPAIVMMSGYCHYHDGAVIDVTSYAIDPARRYERLLGSDAQARLGDIVEMPGSWPYAGELRGMAAKFLAALRAKDRTLLAELHDRPVSSTNEHDQSVLTLLVDQPDSPFAQLRFSAFNAPLRLYVPQIEALQHRQGTKLAFVRGLACFCRTADCHGRWPISLNDGDNWTTRPYACISIHKQDWPGGKLIVETPVSSGGWLKEPAHTAFRGR
jgi:hypothetical protein